MTKVQFNRAIRAMTNSLISMPDDLWGEAFPTISVRVGEVEAFIGMRPINSNNQSQGGDIDD